MKYKNIEVEDVTKENLPKISEVVGENLSLIQDHICFEHSKYCVNKKGEITAVIILKQHSLYDYYNGKIPANTKFKDKHYLKRYLEKWHPNGKEHYEIVYCYLKSEDYFVHLHELYNLIASHDGIPTVGVVWNRYQKERPFPLHCVLYNYNNDIWIGLQIED